MTSCYEPALAQYIQRNHKRWILEHMLPKKGEVLIWYSNALHAGGAVHDVSKTRMSQVTHYFFDDDGFFFEPKLTTFSGNQVPTQIALRADVPAGKTADEMIRLHWDPDDPEYIGHYPIYASQTLRDINLVDLGIERAFLDNL